MHSKRLPKIILLFILASVATLMALASISDSPAVGELSNIDKLLGEDIDLQIARGLVITLSLALLAFVYFWTRGFLGEWWALAPVVITGFSPHFLAYGHYFREEILWYLSAVFIAYGASQVFMNIRGSLLRRSVFRPAFHIGLLILGSTLIYLLHVYGSSSLFINANESLVIYIAKEAMPSSLFIGTAALYAISNMLKKLPNAKSDLKDYILVNPSEFVMMVIVFVLAPLLAVLGEQNNINALSPIIYTLATSGVRNFTKGNIKFARARSIALLTIVLSQGVHAVLVYPNYVNHFSQLAMVRNELEILIRAESDLGVDLLKLNNWLQKRNARIGLDYYGDVDPAQYLGGKYVPWQSSYGEPFNLTLDYVGISRSNLTKARESLDPEEQYLWLEKLVKLEKVGSIEIYEVR